MTLAWMHYELPRWQTKAFFKMKKVECFEVKPNQIKDWDLEWVQENVNTFPH
jgi:hypothetical protein